MLPPAHPTKRSSPSLQAFKSLWFNNFNAKGANQQETMENYYSSCSYQKTFLTNVRISTWLTSTPHLLLKGHASTNGLAQCRLRPQL